jgi:hypothetical protein
MLTARWSALLPIVLVTFATAALAAPTTWQREWPRTDFSRTLVDFGEILSGGPPKDGIPSIDTPRFASIDEVATALEPTEPVMTVVVDGEARAYPLRILMWHEIVNDTLGEVPIAVTFCPLCNSAMVFERVVAGEPTTFGTTGKLRHSDLVMYDRATESWWQQFEGRAIIGEHAGAELKRLPVRLESFADFQSRHPGGLALIPPTGLRRDYGGNPYVGYDTAPRPFLFNGSYDGPGSPLMRVVAIDGADRAWSLELLRRQGVIEHADWIIRWQPGQNSALDSARIADGRDVGTVTVDRVDGDRQSADQPIYDVPFAFAFRAFNPETPIVHVE